MLVQDTLTGALHEVPEVAGYGGFGYYGEPAETMGEVYDGFGVRLAGEVYDLPLHHQPVLGPYQGPPLPVAEDVCARHICLPVHSDMTEDESTRVIEAVTAVHRRLLAR